MKDVGEYNNEGIIGVISLIFFSRSIKIHHNELFVIFFEYFYMKKVHRYL